MTVSLEETTDRLISTRIIPLTSSPVGYFAVDLLNIQPSRRCVLPSNTTDLVCEFDGLPSATKFSLFGWPCITVGPTDVCGEFFFDEAWTVPIRKRFKVSKDECYFHFFT